MTTLSLKIPEHMAERLAAAARVRQQPKSVLVREFIEVGLRASAKGNRPSFHALAKDKAGRFRGPRDLATNPRYLEFGRR